MQSEEDSAALTSNDVEEFRSKYQLADAISPQDFTMANYLTKFPILLWLFHFELEPSLNFYIICSTAEEIVTVYSVNTKSDPPTKVNIISSQLICVCFYGSEMERLFRRQQKWELFQNFDHILIKHYKD